MFAACGNGEDINKKSLKTCEIGKWIETSKKTEVSSKIHEVKFKVNKIEKNQKKVRKIVESYNLTAPENHVKLENSNKNIEYLIAFYDVKYPSNYPAKEFGIMNTPIKFTILSDSGEKEIKVKNTVYKGLNKTQEIGKVPDGYDFYPGKTYHGIIVYKMIKGYEKYLISTEDERDGGETVYIKPRK